MTPEERRKVGSLLEFILAAQRATVDAANDERNRINHIARAQSHLDRAVEIGHHMGMLGVGSTTIRVSP